VATVLNQFDDEDTNKNGQDQGQGSTPTLTAPTTPTIGGPQGGGVATPGSTGTQSGTSSGRFNNLQKYIEANKDFHADQGGLAGQVVSGINQQAQNVQNNLQGAQNAFADQSQQSIDSFNHPDVVNQAFQDPTAFVQNQDNMDAFAKMRDAQYTGPKTLQDLSGDQNLAKLQVQSANVNDMVNQGQSESGRFNLLRNMFGNPSYTAGQQNLDNLIIQGQQGQMKQIQGARQIATDTANKLNQTEQNVEQTAAQAGQQAQGIRDATRGQLNQTAQETANQAHQKYQQAYDKQNQDYSNLQAYLNDPRGFAQSGVSEEDLAKMLQSAGAGADTTKYSQALHQVGANMGDMLSKSTSPTEQNTLDQQDYARINALNSLMGGSNGAVAALANPDVSAALQKYLGNDAQAGGFAGAPEMKFDTNQFNSAVGAARDKYGQEISPYTNQYQALSSGVGGFMPQAQQAVQAAQAKYAETKNLYDMMHIPYDTDIGTGMGLPQNMTNQQLINWYTKSTPTISTAGGGGDHMTSSSGANPYMGLLDQISSTGAQLKDTQGAINRVNNNYGGVFGQASDSDPLAALMAYLGTAPGTTPVVGGIDSNIGTRI
jgi:hypothetical protein